MIHSFRVLLLLVFLSAGTIIQANEPIAKLPFEIHLGHIFMKAKINDGRTLNVVFDTGAGANLVSEEIAALLGLKTNGAQRVNGASGPVTIKSSRKNKLWLSEALTMTNQTFLVMNLDHLGDSDYPLDVIIGGNVLREYVVELNFDNSIISIYDKRKYTARKGFEVQSISLVPYGIPIVTGDFVVSNAKTLTGSYLIDTGAALALRMNTPLVKEHELIESITPNYAYTSRALSNSATDYFGRLNKFKVLGAQFDELPIRMATVTSGVSSWDTVDGIMGLEILKRFNLVFDYSEQAMYIQKSKLFDLPFKDNKSGLKLKKYEGYLEVEAVIEGSAGAKAELITGDQIMKVNGKKNMSHDEFNEYMSSTNKSVSLEVKRDGQIISLKIRPYSMI